MGIRAASHRTASTSRPKSAAVLVVDPRRPHGPRCQQTNRSVLSRARSNRQSSDDDRSKPPLSSLALSLSLSVLFSGALPPPSLAENVRVEDVTSPALRAGLEAANDRRWADAERMFKAYLNEEPSSASGWSNLANVELSTGRPALALEHFDLAVELAPDAAVPRMNRALAKDALSVLAAEAEAGGAKSPSTSPSSRELLASAADDARRASELDPKEFAAFFDLGDILERQGDYEGALSAFSKAADLAPGLPGYRLREAALMFQVAADAGGGRERGGGGGGSGAGRGTASFASVSAARKLVAGVSRKNPTYAEAKAAAAAMAWKAGDTAAAEDALDAAVSLDREWRKPGHARGATRWPPSLIAEYERLLAIE